MSGDISGRMQQDLFRKKMKQYVVSCDSKGKGFSGLINRDNAIEVLERYEDIDKGDLAYIPTSHEFDPIPPSVAARVSGCDRLARLLHDIDRFAELEEDEKRGESAGLSDAFLTGLENASLAIDRVMNDYLEASGVDRDKTVVSDGKKIAEAKKRLKESRSSFEKIVTERLSIWSSHVIEQFVSERGLKMPDEAEYGLYDPAFLYLIDKSDSEGFFEDVTEIYRSMADEAYARSVALFEYSLAVRDMVFDEMSAKDTPVARRNFLRMALPEYRHAIETRLLESIQTREACYYYTNSIINDEATDTIVYERIQRFLKTDADVYEDNMQLSDMPGFILPEKSDGDDREVPAQLEDILEAIGEIEEYRNTHPFLFDAQCLQSMVTDTDGFWGIAELSRKVACATDLFTSKNELKIGRENWTRLFEGWIMADAIAKIAYPIISFVRDHAEATIVNACRDLIEIMDDISYIRVSGESRLAIRELLFKRSGLDVLRK